MHKDNREKKLKMRKLVLVSIAVMALSASAASASAPDADMANQHRAVLGSVQDSVSDIPVAQQDKNDNVVEKVSQNENKDWWGLLGLTGLLGLLGLRRKNEDQRSEDRTSRI